MDSVSRKKRSEIMKAVKNKDSVMELGFRKRLNGLNLKYRKNVLRLKGKPDIYFPKSKLVVFLDSCFWHGCKQHCRLPQTNRSYWITKIKNNKKRDKDISRVYKKMHWTVLRFWEHQIKKDPQKAIMKIRESLKK